VATLSRRLARIAGVLTGVTLLGVAVLHLPSIRARVLERVRVYAGRELDVALRASSLSYNLFARSVELKDVSLASTSAAEPFLEADRVVVELGPGIFLGHPVVTRVSITRPRVTLVRDSNGTMNLPPSRQGAGSSSPMHMGIVSVTALSVRVDDRLAHRSFTVGPLDLAVDTTGAPRQFGAFGPGAFAVRAGQTSMSGSIAGRVAFDGARVNIEELTATTAEGRIALAGWMDVTGERPAMSSKVTGTVDVARAARLAGADERVARRVAGSLDATIDVSGALTAPDLTLTFSGREVSYAPIGPLRLRGRSSLSGSRVVVDRLDVESAAGALHADGRIELGDAAPPSRVALRWSDLRIDDLVRASGYAPPIRSGSLASGSGTIDVAVGDLDARAWSRLRADATTTLHAAPNASGPDVLALSGRADLTLDRGRWSLRHAIETGPARVTLTGDATGVLADNGELRSTLGGRSHLRVADVGDLTPLLRTAGVTLPSDLDGLAGSVTATLDLAGTTGSPRARIDLAARDVRARAMPRAAAIDAQLDVDANAVHARELKASSGTTSLQAAGRYSWRASFDGRVEMTQGDLSEIASQFQLPVAVSGSARMDATISGTDAVVSLAARDLAVEQVGIGPLTAHGRLSLADNGLMTVDASAPDAGARGHFEIVNRAGYPVSGEITLEHDRIRELIPPRYLPEIGDVSGAVSATAQGSGRLSDPAGMRGRIDLRRLDVTTRGTRVVLAAPGSVTVSEDRIAVASVDLRIGERTRATIDGQLGVTALPEPLKVRVESPLAELVDIGSRATGTAPVLVRGDGTAMLDLAVTGTLGHPLPNGTLAVRAASLEYGALAPFTNLRLEAAIDPAVITLPALAAQWQGASIAGDGALPWRVLVGSTQLPSLAPWLNALPAEPARATVTLRADTVTPAVLKNLLGPERLESIQGNASATLTADADRLSLERLRATAVVDRVSLVLAGVRVDQTVPTRLRFENGRASIDAFQWNAGSDSIVVTGGADVIGARPSIDAGVSGVLDLRVVSAFVTGVSSAGDAKVELAITGDLGSPEIVGQIAVSDGELQLDTPRFAASDLTGTVQIAAGRKATVSLAGLLNTGRAKVEGTVDLQDLAAPRGSLHFTGRGVALEFPSGLQTESDADIRLALAGTSSTLSGRVDVLGGTYREPLVLTSQLLNLSFTSGIANAAPPADWLSRMGLDLTIATGSDVRIDNNYGRLDVGANLRVVGTPARPGVLGRLQAADEGEIYLGGNTYRIERLAIDFTSPRAIAPDVNFAAQTRVGDMPIRIELRCPATGACERKISALNGGDDKEAEARLLGTSGGAASAGQGLARLLSGELLGVVGRTVGLDVRLDQSAARRDIFDDPTLVAGDVDPAARLTLGRRVGSGVELVYSQNLADPSFTWITNYTGPRGLSARVLMLDDHSWSYEFRHEPIGGGRARPASRPPGPHIAGVTIDGTPGFPEQELRRHLTLTEGDRFTFGAWQRDRDRLARLYHERAYLEARIRAKQLPADRDDRVTLEYAITRGPATRLIVHGVTLPDAVRDRIERRWTSALFDGFLERDATTIVREHMYREGYLNATVAAAVALDASADVKTLTIDVVPGPVVPWDIQVTGNAALPADQLMQVVRAGDPHAAWLDPRSVERLLEDHYRSEGFLAASVSVSAPKTVNGTSVVTITVSEGTPYAIGEIALDGLPEDRRQDARTSLALSTGERYQPARVAAGVDRLEADLRQKAYRQAHVDVDTHVDPRAARVDVTVHVTPGSRSILRDVIVEGDDAKKPIVARSIALAPGTPLDPAAIGETRRRLYDLDVYRSVEIDVKPVESLAAPSSADAPGEQPVAATITVEQRPRYRLRYGLAVTNEEVGPDQRNQQLGFAADVENRNVFGRGATAGASVRLRQDQQVGRVSLGAKRLFALPIRSTIFVERSREQQNPDGALPITSDISSVTAEQAYRISPTIDLRYGYGFEKNHTFIRSDQSDPFDLTVNIARFTTSGVADRRDDAFNPSRGWFTASTLELSTPGIGSDLKFLKDFAQYSQFFPVRRGLVVAAAARLGLARTFDGEVLIPSERFYAGGGNTVRGYREDTLGAQSALGGPEGGSALLVLNGEVRFPVYRWLKGVGFVDAGNVYPGVRDISLTALQVGIGAGARLDTPFGLIRFDLGVPANPRSIDARWRFHFGFGHSF